MRCVSSRSIHAVLLVSLLCAAMPALAGIPVSGRVLAEEGVPAEGVLVQLQPRLDPVTAATSGFEGVQVEPVAAALTGGDGAFVLDAPGPGAWRVAVEHPGYAPLQIDPSPIAEATDLPDAVLSQDDGFVVKVVDAKGRPVEGANVRLGRETRTRFSGLRGAIMLLGGATWGSPIQLATTDAAGQALLSRSASGSEGLALSVSAPGHLVATTKNLRGSSTTVRLRAGSPRTIEARDTDGSPLARALVVDASAAHPLGWTGDDGRLELSLPDPAEMDVAFWTADGRRAESRVTGGVPAADGAVAPAVIWAPYASDVSGRVVDASSGRGVAGAVVWSRREPWAAKVTGGSGAFSLKSSSGSDLEISAVADGYVPSGTTETDAERAAIAPPAIPLRPGAAVEGVVLDASGEPVAGARVTASQKMSRGNFVMIRVGENPFRKPEALTRPDGSFRISGLDPDQAWTLTADADGYAPSTRDTGSLEPRATKPGMDLELDRGFSITGRVLDEKGSPLEGARIAATMQPSRSRGPRIMMAGAGRGGEPSGESLSSDDGTFRIDGVPAGLFDLAVTHTGYAKRSVAGLELSGESPLADAGDLPMTPGETIQGRVSDQYGEAIEGVEVRARTSGGGPFAFGFGGMGGGEPDATTGPDGWFELSDLTPGERVSIGLAREGYIDESVPNVDVPRLEPIEVKLSPSSTLSGVVLDPEGSPIPGARLTLERNRTMGGGGNVAMFRMQEGGEATDTGDFEFTGLEPGEVVLEATAFGFGTARRTIRIPEGEDVEGVELPLEQGAVLTGRVLLSDGRPAIGVRVGQVSEEAGMPGMGGVPTDGDGHYVLEGLDPGPVSIEAVGEAGQRTVRDVELQSGMNDLNLEFVGGQNVSGIVRDAGGAPLSGALVRLSNAGRQWGGPEERAADDGSFTFEGIQDGSYELRASREGFASSAPVGLQVAGQPVDGLEVVLEQGATLTGTISGLSQEDYGKVEVSAFGQGVDTFRTGRVASDGTFELENLSPGAWSLRGQVTGSGRQARADVSVGPGELQVTAELQFGAGVTLRGVALMNGAPVPGASLFVSGVDVSSSSWAQTTSEGRFEVEGLEPGEYEVALRDFDSGLSYSERVTLDADREVTFEIPTSHVDGVVVDAATDEPVPGVRVWVEPASGEGGIFAGVSATTDLDGKFRLSPVTGGEWRLGASKKGYAAIQQQLSVQEGRSVDGLDLRLDPTEGVTLLVNMPSGRPAERVTVAVLDAAGKSLFGGSYGAGENGKVRVGTVPPGSWLLLVEAPGAATTPVQVQSPSSGTPVTLLPTSRVEITVPELVGSGVAARVSFVGSDGTTFRDVGWFGEPRSEWGLVDGRTVVEELPAGSWQVTVTATDGRVWTDSIASSAGSVTAVAMD